MLEILFPTEPERSAFYRSVIDWCTFEIGDVDNPNTELTLAESLKGAKETALSLALALNHPKVGTGHLFFAILAIEEDKNLGRRVMIEAGLDKERVKTAVALVYAPPGSFSNEI